MGTRPDHAKISAGPGASAAQPGCITRVPSDRGGAGICGITVCDHALWRLVKRSRGLGCETVARHRPVCQLGRSRRRIVAVPGVCTPGPRPVSGAVSSIGSITGLARYQHLVEPLRSSSPAGYRSTSRSSDTGLATCRAGTVALVDGGSGLVGGQTHKVLCIRMVKRVGPALVEPSVRTAYTKNISK